MALALLLAAAGARAASYPPGLRFRTLTTDRVSVHFHDGCEALARQAATLAGELLEAHERRYLAKVGRVQLVVVDSSDDPNGFASPLPYPLVTIHAAAPRGEDDFGNHEGWLRLVLAHELAHVVHLEQARGLPGVGRRVFGRAPFLFPNSVAMSWMIEGLATYEETELTSFGRGRNADSQMVLRMAALEGRFPREDQAVYGLDAWPSGHAPYIFGEAFLRRLSEQAGEQVIPRLARQHAGQVVPFLDGRSFSRVTGRGLRAQWQEWAVDAERSFAREAATRREAGLTRVRRLTDRGVRQAAPRFSPDGSWIAYTSGTLTRFPQLRLVRPDGSGDRVLALRNGGSGLAWTPDGLRLVFAELQVHRTFSVFGDLSAVEVASGRIRRLTRGARAADPDVSPDGGTIVFVRRQSSGSDLFTVATGGGTPVRLTTSVPGVEWSGPRYSPDGRTLVAARLLPGGWLDLVRVDPWTGSVGQLTHDRAADVEPCWTPDGRTVVFRSDRDGISNLYALRLADHALVRVTNVLGGAFQPSVSPAGDEVAFSDYTARGYDIAVAPLALDAAPPAPPFVDRRPAPRPDPAPLLAPDRPYRPVAMLRPRFWSPWIEASDEETRIGAATGGSDPLFRHVWGFKGTYGSRTGRAGVSGFYVYDRFRPTFVIGAGDTRSRASSISEEGDAVEFTRRKRRLTLQASLPLRRSLRAVQTVSLGYRIERESAPTGGVEKRTGGIEAAWTLASARSYPYSVSPVDGGHLGLAWLHAAPALGARESFEKVTVDARYYRRLAGERDVLALQLKAGTSFGEPTADPFAVGGYPDSGLFDEAANLALLRGYRSGAFTGRRFACANLEYRFPLVSPQRGWRSLPVFLRHLRGSVFVDMADAWSGPFRAAALRRSAGASLGADSALGHALPATAELAVAHGFDEQGDTRVSLRFGLAF